MALSIYNKSFKEIFSQYKLVFYAYFLLIILYIIFFCILRQSTICWFNNTFKDNSYGVGISTNILAGLISFGVLGIVTMIVPTILSTKEPRDQEFRDRIKALVNSEKIAVDDELYKYLKFHFSSILAFNKNTTIQIEIRDYDHTTKAYLVYIEIVSTLSNMCKDVDYNANVELFVSSDVCVNNDWGMVVRFETKNISKDEAKIPRLKVKKINEEYQLNVPKNEEIELTSEYIVWSKAGSNKSDNKFWYFYQALRFTRSVKVSLINKLPDRKTLKFEARYAEKDVVSTQKSYKYTAIENVFDLQYDVLKEIDSPSLRGGIYPDDRLEFFFYELT